MNASRATRRGVGPWAACLLLAGCSTPGLFIDVAGPRGLEYISYSGDYLWYLLDTLGSGVAAGDYDGDGDPDLYFLSGSAVRDEFREEAAEHADALWRNDGGGRFTDVTREAGLGASGWSNGAVFGDYDGDADLDLFVARLGPSLLYRNEADGTFTEVGEAAGITHRGYSAGAAFGDLDGDGDLDLFVTHYAHFDPESEKGSVRSFQDGLKQFPIYFEPQDDVLYRNNGNGTFTDITRAAGAAGTGRGLGVLLTDTDGDGDLDVFIANDVGPNDLLRNDGGRFTNVALLAGVAVNGDGQFEASMGVAGGDYDNDGDIDIIVTNYAGEPNTLYRNEGDGLFLDVTRTAGLINQTVLDCVGWGVGLHDLDLDGNLDLFVVNGHIVTNFVGWYMKHFGERRDDVPQMRPEAFNLGAEQPKHLFLGRGAGKFEDVSDTAGREITRPRMGRGAAFADFDGDGRVDAAVSNKNDAAEVLLNRLPRRGNWAIVELRAPPPNTFGVGARVEVTAGGRTCVREVYAGTSYLSADDLAPHFGVGAAERLERVAVRWPDGTREVFSDLPANRRLRLRKGDGTPPAP